MAITRTSSLIDRSDPKCPIRKQAIPRLEEFRSRPARWSTPAARTPIPGAWSCPQVPDRLLIVTDSCAMYCRYCTRKRMVGEEHPPMPVDRFDDALKYLRSKSMGCPHLRRRPLMMKSEVLEN
jgi:lysine 2,3-aminomutase